MAEHVSNNDLYRNIPKITIKIRAHRMRFSGYCWRSREKLTSEVIVWEHLHGNKNLDG